VHLKLDEQNYFSKIVDARHTGLGRKAHQWGACAGVGHSDAMLSFMDLRTFSYDMCDYIVLK